MRWKVGSGRGAAPFAVAGGFRGSGMRGHRPGDVAGSRLAFVRARYHVLLRLAPILRVSVARVGQADVGPVGVSDRQALSGCVAQPRVVELYKGVPLGRAGSPRVLQVYGRVRSRWCDVHRLAPWWEEASSQPSCRLLPCAWPARDLCRACVAVCRRCGSCGRVRLRVLGVPHASHKGAAEGTEDIVHKGPACRPGLRRSADGRLPSFVSASAHIWWIAVFDNTPPVIGLSVGPACMAGPFARSLVDPLRGRGGSGGTPGPGVALPPFPVAGGSRGPGKCGPRPGDVGGGRWGFIRVGHHGLLRRASSSWAPVVRAG